MKRWGTGWRASGKNGVQRRKCRPGPVPAEEAPGEEASSAGEEVNEGYRGEVWDG